MSDGPRMLRWLLGLYPPRFRRRHGAELLRFLRHQRRESRYGSPVLGPVRFWVEVLWDLLQGAARAWLDEARDGLRPLALAPSPRMALRSLRRSPGFSALVTLTLALGIGATTAVFSLADWALFRPVPAVGNAERVVTVRFRGGEDPGAWFLVSHPDFRDLRAGTAGVLETLAATRATDVHLTPPGAEGPLRLTAELVSDDYFATLDLRPAVGRPPTPAAGEDPRIVVVSHRLWRGSFAADPRIQGRTVTINGEPFTVVGVAPEGYRGPEFPGRATDLWMPMEAHGPLLPRRSSEVLSHRRGGLYFSLYGRLRDGATVDGAAARLSAVAEALARAHGGEGSLDGLRPEVRRGAGVAPWARSHLGVTIRILAGVAAGLLLLACANAANLLVARTLRRSRELAVRRALGAGRVRIAGQLLAEGAALGLAGGAAGLALAAGLLQLFQGSTILPWLRAVETVRLDVRVGAFAAGVSLLTGVLSALLPALGAIRSRSTTPRRAAAVGAEGGPGSRARLRRGLVAAQVALSLALLIGAGLLMESLRTLKGLELGFEPAGVLEATADPGTQGYDAARTADFWRELLRGARGLPGVSAAGVAWLPLQGSSRSGVRARPADGRGDREVRAGHNQVSDGFLRAAGLELLAGRGFRPSEVGAEMSGGRTPGVVIVSESLAEALFSAPAPYAVGRTLRLSGRDDRTVEIVGVVADARHLGPRERGARLLLEPLGQAWRVSWGTLYLRASRRAAPGGPAAPSLRRVVRGIDPGLPLYDVQPLEERVSASLAEERLLARLSGLFALLALGLAGVGLYAVLSSEVVARSRELGVRASLGASAGALVSLVLGRSLAAVVLGLLAGLPLALAVPGLVADRLPDAAVPELRILAAAATTLVAVAALASLLPARRALRVDPGDAIRAE